MKKCSPSLDIKEMQTRTMLKFHLTPVRMTTINTTTNAGEHVGKRKPFYTIGWSVN
jgi:hypothetical protein